MCIKSLSDRHFKQLLLSSRVRRTGGKGKGISVGENYETQLKRT